MIKTWIVEIWDATQGYKSYFFAGCLVAYAIFGVITGQLTPMQAVGVLFGSGTVVGLRSAIAKLDTSKP